LGQLGDSAVPIESEESIISKAKAYIEKNDYVKAKELLEEIIDSNHAAPKNNLAWMYFNGYGVQ